VFNPTQCVHAVHNTTFWFVRQRWHSSSPTPATTRRSILHVCIVGGLCGAQCLAHSQLRGCEQPRRSDAGRHHELGGGSTNAAWHALLRATSPHSHMIISGLSRHVMARIDPIVHGGCITPTRPHRVHELRRRLGSDRASHATLPGRPRTLVHLRRRGWSSGVRPFSSGRAQPVWWRPRCCECARWLATRRSMRPWHRPPGARRGSRSCCVRSCRRRCESCGRGCTSWWTSSCRSSRTQSSNTQGLPHIHARWCRLDFSKGQSASIMALGIGAAASHVSLAVQCRSPHCADPPAHIVWANATEHERVLPRFEIAPVLPCFICPGSLLQRSSSEAAPASGSGVRARGTDRSATT
jgi:hypothetical protein